ncbi:MAG TPA: hypothetical protein DHV62_10190 [Elusimicrobia bacterium]|jgi:NTE family protein|nr:hypothetical protein [Elusimicrobiota bacterium]
MKTAVVLSGGGAKGAFQVGALDYLINEKKIDFEIICGVSAGALNASMVAQGDFNTLKKIWQEIKSHRDIFHQRLFGILGGLFGADSVYCNRPLWKKIDCYVDPEKIRNSGKELRIGTVSLQTGEYISVNQNYPDLKRWILASTAIPVTFEPINLDREQIIDGGVREITPLSTAINLGAERIFVILAASTNVRQENKEYRRLIDIGVRSLDIILAEVCANDLRIAEMINANIRSWNELKKRAENLGNKTEELYKNINFIHEKHREIEFIEIAPEEEVIGTLQFRPEKIGAAISAGYAEAKKVYP